MLYLYLQKRLPKNFTLIAFKTQQLADTQETDSREELSCPKFRLNNDRRKVCVNFMTDTDKLDIVVYRYRNSLYLRNNEVNLKMTKYQSILAKRFIYWTILTYSSSGTLYWMKQPLEIKQTPSRRAVLFLKSLLRLTPGLKMSIEQNSVSLNCF